MTTIWLVGTVLGVLAVEACLLSFWVAPYYRTGFRVVRASVVLPAGDVDLEDLATACAGSLIRPRLAFKRIAPREIAFQEAVLPPALWNPVPVLRGLVILDPAGRRAEVVGILLWYPVVAVIAALIGLAPEGIYSALLVAGGAVCAAWLMGTAQWWQYTRVLQALDGIPSEERA